MIVVADRIFDGENESRQAAAHARGNRETPDQRQWSAARPHAFFARLIQRSRSVIRGLVAGWRTHLALPLCSACAMPTITRRSSS